MTTIRNVHQFVTGATPGNAISNEAQVMQSALRAWGYTSHIFAERIHPSLQQTVRPYTTYRQAADDLLIFHYGLGSDLSDYVKQLDVPVLLIYHNVTPPKYLVGVHPWLRAGAEKGRRELPHFADRVVLALADSTYNQQELVAAGFGQTAVLPLIQPDALFETTADADTVSRFDDDTTNLLFVGRIAANKRQEDVMKALYFYRHFNPAARLLLVGADDNAGPYGRWLRQFAARYDLADVVHFSGHVTLSQLAAYYQVADAFVCMSEHEGFCQPLVESMRFGVPIIAYAETAVPETLGGAGILMQEKQFSVIAGLIHLLQTDVAFREAIVAGQKARASDFDQQTLLDAFHGYVQQAIAAPG